MKILAVDTSTEYCSVALLENNKLIDQINDNTPFSHNKNLFLFIDSLLSRNNLQLKMIDLLGIGAGPGSFTGLRVGVSALKALAYSADIKIVAIDSTDALAFCGYEKAGKLDKDLSLRIFFDGKQKDFFTATYKLQNGIPERVEDIKIVKLIDAAEIKSEEINVATFKTGQIDIPNLISEQFPHAEYIGKLAYHHRESYLKDLSFEPNYYKDFKINVSKKKPLI